MRSGAADRATAASGSGSGSAGDEEDEEKDHQIGGPDGITLESLRKLQNFFGKSKALNERQFVEKLGGVLGRNLSKQKLTHLFMKIDVNSDGTVDWDEFTNFMFLDKKESAVSRIDMGSENAYKFVPVDSSVITSVNRSILQGRHPHRDVIRALIPLPDQGKFLSCSRDGTICFWNPATFQLLKHLQTIEQPDMFRRGINTLGADYLTAAVYMSYSNRLAVASVDNSVSFYDIHGNERVRLPHTSVDIQPCLTVLVPHFCSTLATFPVRLLLLVLVLLLCVLLLCLFGSLW